MRLKLKSNGVAIKKASIFTGIALLIVGIFISPLVTPQTDAANVPWPTDAIVAIAGGLEYTCAAHENGKLYCWGVPNYLFPIVNSAAPVEMNLGGKLVKSISGSSTMLCMIATDNKAYCLGDGSQGSLGNGSTDNQSNPVAVDTSGVLAGKVIEKVSVGSSNACVLDNQGKAYCWGTNNSGALGDGTVVANSLVPVAVDVNGVLQGVSLIDIAVKDAGACAVDTVGKVYCWGNNYGGSLGNGTVDNSSVPVEVDMTGSLAGKTIKTVKAGTSSVCAIASDNKVYCWGDNASGELGNGTDDANSSVPTAVVMTGAINGLTVKELTMYNQACVVASNNQSYCWGNNFGGKIGDGTQTNSNVPVAVNTSGALAGKTIKTISALSAKTCVVASDSQVYCWGNGPGALPQPVSGPGSTVYVLSVAFTEAGGKKVLAVTGGLFGDLKLPITESKVTLDNQVLPACADGFGGTAEEVLGAGYIVTDPNLISDTPNCYYVVKNNMTEADYTDTQVRIWVEDSYTAGTISVNGSEPFSFSSNSTPPVNETQPTVEVMGNSLEDNPVIEARPTFTGKAAAGSTVIVTVRSDPITCTTVADSEGNWTCTLPSSLPAGAHRVFVQVTTVDGDVIELGPYDVSVAQLSGVLPPNTGIKPKNVLSWALI